MNIDLLEKIKALDVTDEIAQIDAKISKVDLNLALCLK